MTFWKVGLLLSTVVCVSSGRNLAVAEQRVESSYTGHHGDLSHIGHQQPEHHGAYARSHPSYEYSYRVDDPHTRDVKGHNEEGSDGKVTGNYWLVQPDGNRRNIKYQADKGRGFSAVVSYTSPHSRVYISKEVSEHRGQSKGHERSSLISRDDRIEAFREGYLAARREGVEGIYPVDPDDDSFDNFPEELLKERMQDFREGYMAARHAIPGARKLEDQFQGKTNAYREGYMAARYEGVEGVFPQPARDSRYGNFPPDVLQARREVFWEGYMAARHVDLGKNKKETDREIKRRGSHRSGHGGSQAAEHGGSHGSGHGGNRGSAHGDIREGRREGFEIPGSVIPVADRVEAYREGYLAARREGVEGIFPMSPDDDSFDNFPEQLLKERMEDFREGYMAARHATPGSRSEDLLKRNNNAFREGYMAARFEGVEGVFPQPRDERYGNFPPAVLQERRESFWEGYMAARHANIGKNKQVGDREMKRGSSHESGHGGSRQSGHGGSHGSGQGSSHGSGHGGSQGGGHGNSREGSREGTHLQGRSNAYREGYMAARKEGVEGANPNEGPNDPRFIGFPEEILKRNIEQFRDGYMAARHANPRNGRRDDAIKGKSQGFREGYLAARKEGVEGANPVAPNDPRFVGFPEEILERNIKEFRDGYMAARHVKVGGIRDGSTRGGKHETGRDDKNEGRKESTHGSSHQGRREGRVISEADRVEAYREGYLAARREGVEGIFPMSPDDDRFDNFPEQLLKERMEDFREGYMAARHATPGSRSEDLLKRNNNAFREGYMAARFEGVEGVFPQPRDERYGNFPPAVLQERRESFWEGYMAARHANIGKNKQVGDREMKRGSSHESGHGGSRQSGHGGSHGSGQGSSHGSGHGGSQGSGHGNSREGSREGTHLQGRSNAYREGYMAARKEGVEGANPNEGPNDPRFIGFPEEILKRNIEQFRDGYMAARHVNPRNGRRDDAIKGKSQGFREGYLAARKEGVEGANPVAPNDPRFVGFPEEILERNIKEFRDGYMAARHVKVGGIRDGSTRGGKHETGRDDKNEGRKESSHGSSHQGRREGRVISEADRVEAYREGYLAARREGVEGIFPMSPDDDRFDNFPEQLLKERMEDFREGYMAARHATPGSRSEDLLKRNNNAFREGYMAARFEGVEGVFPQPRDPRYGNFPPAVLQERRESFWEGYMAARHANVGNRRRENRRENKY